MDELSLGTIDGKPITRELLETLSSRCEKNWNDEDVLVAPTSHGRALAALQALELPVEEIEALERRAQHEKRSLSFFLRTILRNELAGL
jgi:hypothetical protein